MTAVRARSKVTIRDGNRSDAEEDGMTSRRWSGRTGRRALLGGFTGVVGVVALASAAWACTVVMGITKIANPTNSTYVVVDKEGKSTGPGLTASPGQVVKVSAWELQPNTKYKMWFVYPSAVAQGFGCHHAGNTGVKSVAMQKPDGTPLKMKSNSQGQLDRDPNTSAAEAYKGVIPTANSEMGTAELCGVEIYPDTSGANHSATQHVKGTIV